MAANVNRKIFEILDKMAPANAAQYCWDLWHEDPFHLVITRKRKSKLGDFRYNTLRKFQTITLNQDLHSYQFLITYIHEVAHYRAFKKFGTSIKPHGPEWKMEFRKLMSPMLSDLVFPKDILLPLKNHMQNPKASSGVDFWLTKELRKYSNEMGAEKVIYLGELKPGSQFLLRGRIFQKIETKRTRVLCTELDSGQNYLIASHAEVKLQR
ncbi:SprT-like domain-containing protein [Echinicola jeungdonensis]|uniref:SprT-like domain-containing protein n=1 Tax=Echinicola jeungdonensis TaxID=709343 RepID=A0ABV5J4X3_9BACT|nr:SprT-like domain-containing protein [Echinicola jeungdonensis]MDN3668800.1 SprT-like domain-containing protein [Echinicola jeungdonensis]